MRKGSVTVFIALVMTAMFSAIFAFLECARVSCLKAEADMFTQQARDAVLASYNVNLWDKYGMLMWEEESENVTDMTELENFQKDLINCGNIHIPIIGNQNLIMLTLDEVDTTAVQLATDDDGAVFKAICAAMAPEGVLEMGVDELVDLAKEAVKKKAEGSVEDKASKSIDDFDAQKESQKSAQSNSVSSGTGGNTSGQSNGNSSWLSGNPEDVPKDNLPATVTQQQVGLQFKTNPLDWFKRLKKNGVLGIVTDDVSGKSTDLSDSASKRQLQHGNWPEKTTISLEQDAMFRTYLVTRFANKLDGGSEGNALDYEMEYIIGGKDSDKGNLKYVVAEILVIREIYNFALIETDTQKKQTAEGVALAICSAVGLPAAEKVVKHGLLAVWAFAESVHDTQTLFDGDRVPIVKTREDWYTDLQNIAQSTEQDSNSRNPLGFDYKTYLVLMMQMNPDSRLVGRAMDIIEQNAGIKMDHMVTKCRCEYKFTAPVLFWKMVSLGNRPPKEYIFNRTNDISFY